jgi:hypothetical protein
MPLHDLLRLPGERPSPRDGAARSRAADQLLDRLAATAARLMGGPIALVTLAERDGRRALQRAAGLTGPWADGPEAGLALRLCRESVAARDARPVLIEDARRHPLRAADAALLEASGVRAYAGVPLRSYDGQVLGVQCVMDWAPRAWAAADVGVVEQVGTAAVLDFQLRVWAEAVHGPQPREIGAEGEPGGGVPDRRDGAAQTLLSSTDALWHLGEEFVRRAAAYDESLAPARGARADAAAVAAGAQSLEAAQDALRAAVARHFPAVAAAAVADGLPDAVSAVLGRAAWALWRASDDYRAQSQRQHVAAGRFAAGEVPLAALEAAATDAREAEAALGAAVRAYRTARSHDAAAQAGHQAGHDDGRGIA